MVSVPELYGLDAPAIGNIVQARGLLLGGKHQYIADSIEDFDRGIAVPLLDDTLYERMFNRGVYSLGGGRFGFSYECVIEAELAPGARGYKYSLTNIVYFAVQFRGKKVLVIAGGACQD